MNNGGFSWKRLTGVSRAISRMFRTNTDLNCLVALPSMLSAGLVANLAIGIVIAFAVAPKAGTVGKTGPLFSERLAELGVSAYARADAPGPEVPGLEDNWVPQGLVGLNDGRFLISAYQYELKTGEFTHRGDTRVSILEMDAEPVHGYLYRGGKRFQGHVGGVAVHGDNMLVADGASVYRAKMPTDEAPIELKRAFRTNPILASCVAVDGEGRIWVGEHRRRVHNVIQGHTYKDSNGIRKYALIGVYSAIGDLQAVLTVRQKLQGIAFHDDVVVLSLSYGRRNRSVLAFFRNPLIHQEPVGRHPRKPANDEATVPLYHLDSKIGEFKTDPMSEEIWLDPETLDLWVIFESGSTKFKSHPLPFTRIRMPFRVKGRINHHLVRYALPTSTDL